jgi:predicted peptidase
MIKNFLQQIKNGELKVIDTKQRNAQYVENSVLDATIDEMLEEVDSGIKYLKLQPPNIPPEKWIMQSDFIDKTVHYPS